MIALFGGTLANLVAGGDRSQVRATTREGAFTEVFVDAPLQVQEENAKNIVDYPVDHGLIQRKGFTASMTFDAPTPEEVSAYRVVALET
jgi:adenylylsulfate kinase-like enzyme